MTVYEIIRTNIIHDCPSNPKFEQTLIYSTTSEDEAVRILNSCKRTQGEDESYQIRTVNENLKMHKW